MHFNDRWSKKLTLLPEDWPERIHIVERWNKLLTLPPVDWPDKIQLYGHEEGLRIWHAYTTHVLETTNSTNPVVHGIDHVDMVVGICICQVQLQAL
jgi:hypothetical protein